MNKKKCPICGTESKMNFIDLCLPSGTLWADTNVGALAPHEYGEYFNFEGAQKQGALPAHWQMAELVECTTHEVCDVDSVKGMQFVGKNGNSIFIPFAGLEKHKFHMAGEVAFVWSCTPIDNYIYGLCINCNDVDSSGISYRSRFQSVRLIKNKE